ncbi:hypothetical protein KO481_24150 [Nocardia sp. NEAU-G5]|uniref:Uncharacterized protein n=1 Tax=Nocardia albiluteola TaxID=2842303 RepID=A0ABS6B2T8_9NOCA|nr:hypothetical protein [Nocardia albiluteola]MBU3064610.1 hypothetical protein [Nocardia albiluteola]
MANPYQPGPAPMPSAPPPGYGWPAQPGSPAGQTYSPYPTPKPAGPRNVPALCAAGLGLLALLIDIGRMFAADGAHWLTDWTVVGWILMAAAAITGVVQTFTNRNLVAARITVALAIGATFSGQVFTLLDSFLGYGYYSLTHRGHWLSIPGALVSVAAIVLLYIASRADAAKSGAAQPATPQSAQPGWPPQPQAPSGQQPPMGFPGQQPAGFPQQQPPSQPSGFPQQQPLGSQLGGFPQQPLGPQPGAFPQQQPSGSQPSGFPQQQLPGHPAGLPQQPAYQPQGFPGQQHPGFAAPQPAPAQPGQFVPPPGAFGAPPQPLQHPNPPAALQDSGNQPTVMHQPASTPDNQQTILQQPGTNPPPQPGSPFPQPNASDAGSPHAADPTVYQPPSTPQGPQQ